MSEEPNLHLGVFGDDFAFLELQAEETGLAPEQVVAMLIRKARKAYEKPPVEPAPDAEHVAKMQELAERERQRRAEIEEKRAQLQAQLAALDDPSLSQQIYADDAPEIGLAMDLPSLPEFDESLLRQPEPDLLRTITMAIPSSAAPGSLTGPVGVRRDLRGGDIMGDPKMNIIRRNYRHLGAG